MARKGALTKDPKKNNKAGNKAGNKSGNKSGNGESYLPTKEENLAIYNNMSPEQQAEYRNIRKKSGGPAALKFLQNFQSTQTQTSTPESVTEQGFMGAGQAYQDMLQRFGGEQYQPQFEQEMERARQNVMGQFERRNAEEFGRQQVDVQRQIAERGLDPNSEAAQGLYKQLNQRQDMARQEAIGAAEQAAYSVQNQQFGQAGQLAMRPYEQWGVLQQPYLAGIGAQYQSQESALQRQFEEAMRVGDRKSAERIAGMARRGGGGGGGEQLTEYQIMERNQLNTGYPGKQPNIGAQVVGGVVQGVGGQIINRTNR
jgi:hypothetical protein